MCALWRLCALALPLHSIFVTGEFGQKEGLPINLQVTSIPAFSKASASFRVAERLYFFDAMYAKTALLRNAGLAQRCPKVSAALDM